MKRAYRALYLVSLAIIGFQIALMQVLSLAQWPHFATVVISVALLGFGCSGTLLAVARPWMLAHRRRLLPGLLLACAATMTAALPLTHGLFGGFDVYLLPVDGRQFWLLLATQLTMSVPMLCGALAIGLLFISRTERIGSLYFANLFGSACGGIVALALLQWLPPSRVPGLFALLPLLAALPRGCRTPPAAWLAVAAAVGAGIAWPPAPSLSPYKPISYALSLPGARISAQQPSAYGLLQRVEAPALRYAPELSLAFAGEVPPQPMIYANGDLLGPAPGAGFDDAARLLDASPRALPWAIALPARVLIADAGSGVEARYARLRGASAVVALQRHRDLPAFIAAPGRTDPGISWPAADARTVLAQGDRFDLILLPTIGTRGGDAGLGALAQDYLLTTEGMGAMWQRLSTGGMLSIGCWIDEPPRYPLRLAATLVTLLEAAGVDQPAAHLAAVRSWASITFVVTREPLDAAAIGAVRGFARDLQLDPALLPGLRPEEREHFHALGDAPLLALLDTIVRGDRQALTAAYPFRLQAATDDRPFFSQFLRWRSLGQLAPLIEQRQLPAVALGYLLIALSLLQLLAASTLLIAGPLVWAAARRQLGSTRALPPRRGGLACALYFGCLGLGFMCFEIALLHHLAFYLGEPVFAAAAAIGLMLLFAGIGSYLTGREPTPMPGPRRAALAVACLIALLAGLLPAATEATAALGLAAKLTLAVALIAPAALLMGAPFPTALRQLSRTRPDLLPWAWGINGYLSVLATPLATLIALEAGFSRVMLLAALSYALAALAAGRLPGDGLATAPRSDGERPPQHGL